MKTKYLDTSLILRLIIKDNLDQLKNVKSLLQKSSQREFKLFCSTVVFFECEWVLRSFYKLKPEDIVIILQKILSLNEIDFENEEVLFGALELMGDNKLGLEDNFHLSYCRVYDFEIETFDKKLKKYKFYNVNYVR